MRFNGLSMFKNQCKRAKLIIEKKPKNEYELIRMRAVCCDKNEIFEYLESSLEKSQLDMELIRYDPFFQLIQDNDQFGKLINRYANIDHFDMIPFM